MQGPPELAYFRADHALMRSLCKLMHDCIIIYADLAPEVGTNQCDSISYTLLRPTSTASTPGALGVWPYNYDQVKEPSQRHLTMHFPPPPVETIGKLTPASPALCPVDNQQIGTTLASKYEKVGADE